MATAPSTPINRLPAGLLSFLDLKTMGRNPNQLEEKVQPIVDLFPHYMQQCLQWYVLNSLTSDINGVGIFTSFYFSGSTSGDLPVNAGGEVAVPQDELWYVDYMAVSCALFAIGDYVQPGLGFRPAANTGPRSILPMQNLGPVNNTATVAGQRFWSVIQRPFWMRGGDRLFWVSFAQVTSGATSYLGTASIARFKV